MTDHSLDMLAGVPTKGLRHHVKIAGIGKIIMEGLIAEPQHFGGGKMIRGQRLTIVAVLRKTGPVLGQGQFFGNRLYVQG